MAKVKTTRMSDAAVRANKFNKHWRKMVDDGMTILQDTRKNLCAEDITQYTSFMDAVRKGVNRFLETGGVDGSFLTLSVIVADQPDPITGRLSHSFVSELQEKTLNIDEVAGDSDPDACNCDGCPGKDICHCDHCDDEEDEEEDTTPESEFANDIWNKIKIGIPNQVYRLREDDNDSPVSEPPAPEVADNSTATKTAVNEEDHVLFSYMNAGHFFTVVKNAKPAYCGNTEDKWSITVYTRDNKTETEMNGCVCMKTDHTVHAECPPYMVNIYNYIAHVLNDANFANVRYLRTVGNDTYIFTGNNERCDETGTWSQPTSTEYRDMAIFAACILLSAVMKFTFFDVVTTNLIAGMFLKNADVIISAMTPASKSEENDED